MTQNSSLKMEEVADKIITLMEQKQTLVWTKPWNANSRPRNLVSKRPYSGVNLLLLAFNEYKSPYYATFKQIKDLKGFVKKGEHGTPILKVGLFIPYEYKNKMTKEEVNQALKKGRFVLDGIQVVRTYLKFYTVFNLEQTTGIEKPEEKTIVFNPIEEAEKIVAEFVNKPPIAYAGDQAFYRPEADTITVPEKNTFNSSEEYYSTLFHELVHSTGHKSRLDRFSQDTNLNFGKEAYSKEELVAEMGNAFLCGLSGIENKTIDNSTAYLQHWLKALKADKMLLIEASSKAREAVDYITGSQSTLATLASLVREVQ